MYKLATGGPAVEEFRAKVKQYRLWKHYEVKAILIQYAGQSKWKLAALSVNLLNESKPETRILLDITLLFCRLSCFFPRLYHFRCAMLRAAV